MQRRIFLQALAAPIAATTSKGRIMTVRGPVDADDLGTVLPHEHLFSNFGLDPADPPVYETQKLMREVLRYVSSVKFLGCGTILDCTTQYFGRQPELLKRISEGTRVHVVTNTGYYGAAAARYVPASAYDESAGTIASRWVGEFQRGIGDSGIRPGFLKLGVDAGPLNAINSKLVRAAAITHRQTGLAIQVHTGDNPESVRQQLAILREEGVSPAAWIWIHANSCAAHAALLEAARSGAWISLDGISPGSVQQHLDLIRLFKQEGLLGRVLLSHDGNSFRANGTRPMKPYSALFTHFLPALHAAGYTQLEVRLLCQTNPAEAFSLRARLSS